MSTSQVSLLSQAGVPFRGPLTRPVLEAVLQPWLVSRQPTCFQVFDLEFLSTDPRDEHPRLSEGRQGLRSFLQAMSRRVLGTRAFEMGDRLGCAVLRVSHQDRDEYLYEVLLELPSDVNEARFVHVAEEEWPFAPVVHAPTPLNLEQWIDYATGTASAAAYIDSLEAWAWRTPRGWVLPSDYESNVPYWIEAPNTDPAIGSLH